MNGMHLFLVVFWLPAVSAARALRLDALEPAATSLLETRALKHGVKGQEQRQLHRRDGREGEASLAKQVCWNPSFLPCLFGNSITVLV